MTCTCGQTMTVEAASKEEAVAQLKKMMDQAGIDAHWADKHQNDKSPKPTVAQAAMMIEQGTHEVVGM